MNKNLRELKYTISHEWIFHEQQDIYRIGITDYAQNTLGDIVFIDLPSVGDLVVLGQSCAVVESVKSASDIYSPISGKVTMINNKINISPELVNSSPYSEGWLFKVQSSNINEISKLFDYVAYQNFLNEKF